MSTIKERIAEVAPTADLNPKVAQILQDFFLDLASQEDKDTLDLWLYERESNSKYFDLLLEVNRDGTGAAVIATVKQHTQGNRIKWGWGTKIFGAAAALCLVLFVFDRIMQSHPVERSLFPGKFGDETLGLDSVSTGADAKTVWLVDSTRVELGPNSKILYPDGFRLYQRKLQVIGNAVIDFHSEEKGEYLLRVGELEQKIMSNSRIVVENGTMTLQPLPRLQPQQPLKP